MSSRSRTGASPRHADRRRALILLLFLAMIIGGIALCSRGSQEPSTPAAPEDEEQETPRARRERDAAPEMVERPVAPKRRLEGFKAPAELVELHSKNYPGGVVAVTLPLDYDDQPDTTYPLLIAFGGAGESSRPPRDNALAWLDFYDADEALLALKRGVLRGTDFQDLVTVNQLKRFNSRLERQPYRGLILACPASPLLSRSFPIDSEQYEAFIVDEVLPLLLRTYRVTPGKVGVDGVSMGGARAAYFGLKRPDLFKSIGATQGAFARHMPIYRDLMDENREALQKRPIQLITSDGDGLAPAVRLMHSALDAAEIEHRYRILTGPHDYIFNKGPGVLSMLIFHDGALRDTR